MSQDEKAERIKKAQVAYQSGVISEVEYKELVRKIKAGEMPSRRYSDKSESLSRIEHLTQLATGEDMSEELFKKKFLTFNKSVHGAHKKKSGEIVPGKHTRYTLGVGSRKYIVSTNNGAKTRALRFQAVKKTPVPSEMTPDALRAAKKSRGWKKGGWKKGKTYIETVYTAAASHEKGKGLKGFSAGDQTKVTHYMPKKRGTKQRTTFLGRENVAKSRGMFAHQTSGI